jgi:MFS family permease
LSTFSLSRLTKAFHRWLPLHERTRAQGIMWMSARLGGTFTPALVFLCLQCLSWRMAFLLFGLLGVVCAINFFWFTLVVVGWCGSEIQVLERT